jgi:hypothetical protein
MPTLNAAAGLVLAAVAFPLASQAAGLSTWNPAPGAHLTRMAAYAPNLKAPLGSAANPIPENSPTPANLAYKIGPTDANIVTNGPIPDTRANRARYGQPTSTAGRASNPVGN